MARTSTLVDQTRGIGTHETSVVALDSGRLQAATFAITLQPADLVNPATQWALEIWESRDAGQAWTLACRTVDAGRVGRTTAPILKLRDGAVDSSHQFKARLVLLSRAVRCSGSLDV